jgi:hypothetical protein
MYKIDEEMDFLSRLLRFEAENLNSFTLLNFMAAGGESIQVCANDFV